VGLWRMGERRAREVAATQVRAKVNTTRAANAETTTGIATNVGAGQSPARMKASFRSAR